MKLILDLLPDGNVQISGSHGMPWNTAMKMLLTAMEFLVNAPKNVSEPKIEEATTEQIPPVPVPNGRRLPVR